MKLEKITDEHEDCSTGYNVVLHKEYTVKSFIDEMMDDNRHESNPAMKTWGVIYISENGNYLDSIFETDYDENDLKSDIPENFLARKVLDVKASGGWTRMDYIIKIEK